MSQQLRDLTIHKGLLKKLAHLDQEEDHLKAAALFNEAEEYVRAPLDRDRRFHAIVTGRSTAS